ncbi:hypothetical protein ACLX1H_007728 [Fusarium chlamydosporum]
MWAAAMPYYSEYSDRPRRDTQAKLSPQANVGADMTSYYDVSPPTSHSPLDLDEYLVPAVDGPPSPERIRQLSKQMKHASHLNRGQRTASTGSSTFVNGERGWEQGFENVSITRHSSQRSTTTSGSSSRDRPDSVQVLGKNIFHRRAKSSKSSRARRESSAQSSAASSLYSTELGSETSLATFKDSIMPTIFARRKSSRDDAALQKKLQISGPFNFQHVTHTPRDQMANSASRTPGHELRLPNFSASSEHIPEPQVSPRSSRASVLPRRLIKHARSQEQLRTSPPRPVRPPRSPPAEALHSPTLGAPIPPPRGSSRQQRDGDSLVKTGRDRPLTSGGFRHPQPYSPNDAMERSSAVAHGYGVALEEPLPVDDHRFSHAITTPDDAAWPLPATANYEPPLPDVPEEEETVRSPNNTSTRSSLRASQSVPLLRGSQASENVAAQRSAGHYKGSVGHIPSIRESWEDDIDYCYEHEADANFDYEWERPSMDTGREVAPGFQLNFFDDDDELRELPTVGTAESSPGMLSASRFDMPALSPASHASPESMSETAFPNTGMGVAVTNNFSFPRGEKARRPPKLNHSRSDSRSSFKESYGFTLSPSLLIPGDYHQQMLLNESEKHGYSGEDDVVRGIVDPDHPYENASNAASHNSLQMSHQRASTSTTATNSTSLSDSTGERHVSTNSTWTNLTRLTSSTSLNKWVEQNDGIRESLIIKSNDSDEEETTPPASTEKDTVPELTPFPSVPVSKRAHHKSHASESIVREEVPTNKVIEATKTRRPRARTTSLSTQAPPVGQYALFPRAYAKGNGDRI